MANGGSAKYSPVVENFGETPPIGWAGTPIRQILLIFLYEEYTLPYF